MDVLQKLLGLGVPFAQFATFNSFLVMGRVSLKYVVFLFFSNVSCMEFCSGF